jgi:hypothetical protein
MFWGNFGILRCFTKEIILGEFKFGFFEVLGGVLTRSCEEGGQIVFHFVQLGDLSVKIGVGGNFGLDISLRTTVGGWGFTKNIHEGRGIEVRTASTGEGV